MKPSSYCKLLSKISNEMDNTVHGYALYITVDIQTFQLCF